MSLESTHRRSPTRPLLRESCFKDPRTLTQTSEIFLWLSVLQSEEVDQSNSLTELVHARKPILTSLKRLNSLVSRVETISKDASLLAQNVTITARTAERVSGRVQSLDDEMGRVREAGDFVGQVMELKSSLADLQSSIDGQDWEAAARHCARAMSLPSEVTEGLFAEMTVPTSESHLPPAQNLQEAKRKLLNIFQQKFNEASLSRDSTATSRFFKLFPAIGCEEDGLDAYASFVVDLVHARVPASATTSSPLYYITALTALFESIAMIVDHHQPVVEKYYGPGKMRHVVQRLLLECDRVVKGIIDSWEADRAVKHKLVDTSNNQPIPIVSLVNKRPVVSMGVDEDIVDPRDIDRVISELAGMIGRWNLFRKFLIESLSNELAEFYISGDLQARSTVYEETREFITGDSNYIDSTKSFGYFNSLVTTYYIPLEIWYIRSSIVKAHQVSSTDISQSTPVTTAPDDVFYIIKVVISRLLSTGALGWTETVLERIRDVIEQDHTGLIKKKLEDVYRGGGTSAASRGEKMDRDNRITIITMLNDFDVSSTHMERLINDLSRSQIIAQYFIEEHQERVRGHLIDMSNLVAKICATSRLGVEQMFNQLVRPKLRTLILDVYKDVSYVLDDEGYSAAEQQDVVRKRFVRSWEGTSDGYQDTFTETNYRIFFCLAVDVILRPWEKLILTLKFTELGAIRFDRDLRSILTFLASQTAFGDAREKFIRLQQVSTLLNLDAEEDIDEFYNGSGIVWKLSMTEARMIVGLKL